MIYYILLLIAQQLLSYFEIRMQFHVQRQIIKFLLRADFHVEIMQSGWALGHYHNWTNHFLLFKIYFLFLVHLFSNPILPFPPKSIYVLPYFYTLPPVLPFVSCEFFSLVFSCFVTKSHFFTIRYLLCWLMNTMYTAVFRAKF